MHLFVLFMYFSELWRQNIDLSKKKILTVHEEQIQRADLSSMRDIDMYYYNYSLHSISFKIMCKRTFLGRPLPRETVIKKYGS